MIKQLWNRYQTWQRVRELKMLRSASHRALKGLTVKEPKTKAIGNLKHPSIPMMERRIRAAGNQ